MADITLTQLCEKALVKACPDIDRQLLAEFDSLASKAKGVTASDAVKDSDMLVILGYARALNAKGQFAQAKDLIEPFWKHLQGWCKVGAAINLAHSYYGLNKAAQAQLYSQSAITVGGFLLWEKKKMMRRAYEIHLKVCKASGDRRTYTNSREQYVRGFSYFSVWMNEYAEKNLAMIDSLPFKSGSSLGLVMGGLLVAGAIAGGVYYYLQKKK